MSEIKAMKSRGRPKDLEKTQAILRAARELFMDQGFSEASMDAIAERAGVSKATLYSHFADKNALFNAVLANETQDYKAPSDPVDIADLGALRSQLLGFGESLLGILTRPGVLDLGRLLINESRRHPEHAAHFFARGPEATHLRLANLLATAHQNKLIECDNPSIAADHLLSMWIGQRHLRQQLGLCPPPTPEEVNNHVASCVDVILKAYTASIASAKRPSPRKRGHH